MKPDITVIILTKDEKLHIGRCLDNVEPIARRVFVVDSGSTDGTREIAFSKGAEVVEHKWPGNQAAQFNWALDNLPITTEWVLRLDADEYLTNELIAEISRDLRNVPSDVSGIVLKRRHIFLGKWMRRGIYPVKILRLFRYGAARYEQRLMDEHVIITDGGKEKEFQYDFCDHNLNNLSWFCKKHIDYAVREAAELLDLEFGLTDKQPVGGLSAQAASKRKKKHSYARQPLFWRSFAYFLYRYFAKGAFLDGKEGFLFSFLQGWWYRTLVDAKVLEIKQTCGNDPAKIRRHLAEVYGVIL